MKGARKQGWALCPTMQAWHPRHTSAPYPPPAAPQCLSNTVGQEGFAKDTMWLRGSICTGRDKDRARQPESSARSRPRPSSLHASNTALQSRRPQTKADAPSFAQCSQKQRQIQSDGKTIFRTRASWWHAKSCWNSAQACHVHHNLSKHWAQQAAVPMM
ncbi:unnamed protein product [Polarella glacialis]|uniref:Uncharacterized protein n=1 Tax=Polarella glacialis TaxID=89957 RepID=A0A813HLR0_POLGL|nr:unnamed protein product [Polarella glacialis]